MTARLWFWRYTIRARGPLSARAVSNERTGALIRDLKRRGLLESTLVVWAAEFGRTPFAQGGDGRPILSFCGVLGSCVP